MPQISESIYAPELQGGEWIQHGPVSVKALRGKSVILIDFWDYTCVNCIRTLPYVVQWNQRYAASGLTVVGVHAPEFSFAREESHVVEAAARFGLQYPIVLDNEYAIWRAYTNRCWPAKYLIDAKGRIRYYHFGEGSYQETELAIQRLLRDLGPTNNFPPPVEPMRDTDRPGAVCYRVTPELYLGYARGQFGNPANVLHDQAHDYVDVGPHMEGMSYLTGRWRVEEESARAESPGASIALKYTARDVNLVMAPPAGATGRVEVKIGGAQKAGDDVQFDGDRGFVNIDAPRMYSLIANDSVVSGSIVLRAEQAGLSAYAFTFISCAVS